MIKRLKVVGLALAAVFALAAVMASAASATTTILPEFSKEVSGTGTSGTGTLSIEGNSVSCNQDTSTFGPLSKKLGTFRILFLECKNTAKPCWSLGLLAGSGLIEITGEYHLVPNPSNPRHWYLWFLVGGNELEFRHIECTAASLLIEFWGNLLGLITAISELTYKVEVESEGGGTTIKQTETEFHNNTGETVKASGLEGRVNEGMLRPGGEKSAENLIHFSEDVSILES